MGELICYSNPLTTDEARRIDAYLNYKWFGREPDAWNRPAHVGVLDVAAGATVNVDGGAPIVCSSLRGAGTVNGDVKIAGDAAFEVFVNQDGSITDGLTVSGAVDMSHGGVIRLTGHVNALVPGVYSLVSSPEGIVYGDGDWIVEGYSGKLVLELLKRDGSFALVVIKKGFALIYR